MMSSQCSWISIILAMVFVHIISISSTPILSESNHHHHLTDENAHDNQHSSHAFLSFIKSLLDETNPHEQVKLMNQLREYLNEICSMGYLGATHGQACQHVLEVLHQNSLNHHSNEETSDTSNEPHGIQKRFFCNGFIGCKSSSG